jgi:hypothetical protein
MQRAERRLSGLGSAEILARPPSPALLACRPTAVIRLVSRPVSRIRSPGFDAVIEVEQSLPV